MKRKRFSVEQIVTIVKQAEMGLPVAELIRRVGISEQTFYRWKKQYSHLWAHHNRERSTSRVRANRPTTIMWIASTERRGLSAWMRTGSLPRQKRWSGSGLGDVSTMRALLTGPWGEDAERICKTDRG
jgi:hypothetical protein